MPYGRQTGRLLELLQLIGYALGGEAGWRLAERIGVESSPDTILRKLKQSAAPKTAPVRVLGVDDWAWRKGHEYGTIWVDLERHQPVDLLPDREAETLRRWLEAHPGIRIVSRDRASAYAEGARKGASEALQVADRFHILCNLTQALQRVLERLAGTLRQIRIPQAEDTNVCPSPSDTNSSNAPENMLASDAPTVMTEEAARQSRHQKLSQERRERRRARFEAVVAASQKGLSDRAIARELGMGAKTVARFLRAGQFPECAPRYRRTALTPFQDYLARRGAEGCHNATQLCRELQQQGYTGQRSRVRDFLRPWRTKPPSQFPKVQKLPSPRVVALWLSKPEERRPANQQQIVRILTAAHPEVARAESLAQGFRAMLRSRSSRELGPWLHRAHESGIAELQGFASSIERDRSAVSAGITEPWSNGQVEGQVHRLKCLKRQMYGRAGFLLLRQSSSIWPSRQPNNHSRTLRVHQNCG